MAGIAAVIVNILPNSPEADLNEIKDKARELMEAEGAKNLTFEEIPIAFGLKSISLKMAWPEEKDTDLIDNKLSAIKNVTSATIEDYRRAFG